MRKWKKESEITRVYNRLMAMNLRQIRLVVSSMPAGWSLNEIDDCVEIIYNGHEKGLDALARSIVRNHKEWVL